MTAVIALNAVERAILDAYARGDSVPTIATDHAISVSSVRGFLYRSCDFNRRRAQVLLEALNDNEPEPAPWLPPEPEPDPDDTISTAELAQQIGLSWRQVDHWCRVGYLQTTGEQTPGTGHKRWIAPDEAAVATLMARLVRAGLYVPAAHFAARNGLRLLDPGVRIVIDGAP
jgi:hypothetical protein